MRGCDFQFDANQINLGSTLKKAVITGNLFTVSDSCSIEHFLSGHQHSLVVCKHYACTVSDVISSILGYGFSFLANNANLSSVVIFVGKYSHIW